MSPLTSPILLPPVVTAASGSACACARMLHAALDLGLVHGLEFDRIGSLFGHDVPLI